MAMERWNPMQEIMSLRQAMDRLLEDAVVRPGTRALGAMGTGTFPLDVAETADAFTVHASLPGVTPDQLQLTIEGSSLRIHAQSQTADEREGQRWLLRERQAQAFDRAIQLPTPVDAEHAEAHFEHGVLTLTLPKAETAKPRQIPIRGAAGQGASQSAGANRTSGH